MTGFKKLKPGCIHMLCPGCGRKQSNMPREDHDPVGAFVLQTKCPECAGGDFTDMFYMDSEGNEITETP